MCDAAEWGVQLCQEAVCSDRGECFSDRGGETWSPSCARSFAQIAFLHLRSSNSFGRCLDQGLDSVPYLPPRLSDPLATA